MKAITACRICGNTDLRSIVELGDQALTGIFPRSKEDKITVGPLNLVRCNDSKGEHCGLLQLQHSYDSSEMYGANYGYRSGLNKSMVDHLKDIVLDIKGRIKLQKGDAVIDIGSNDSTLLQQYGLEGINYFGIDPTSDKFAKYYPEHIQRIADFFNKENAQKLLGDQKAKVISSIAMFYDLEDPQTFVNDVFASLDDEGIWVFEQSYMPLMLQENAYDTICHEHVEYYAFKQVNWMLEKAGFKAIDVDLNDTNGGSFRVVAAKKGSSHQTNSENIQKVIDSETALELDTDKPYCVFKSNIENHRVELFELLTQLKKDGKKVFGYGASTKGNVILQHCGIGTDLLPYIAEVNEDKYGAFTPATHIPIISEKEAKEMNPDYFLVLPWHFKNNFLEREKEFMSGGGKLIFPLPKIEII